MNSDDIMLNCMFALLVGGSFHWENDPNKAIVGWISLAVKVDCINWRGVYKTHGCWEN
jgi:hypothetical protein